MILKNQIRQKIKNKQAAKVLCIHVSWMFKSKFLFWYSNFHRPRNCITNYSIFNWYYFLLPGDSTVTAINSCTRFCMADCTYVNSYERCILFTVFMSWYKMINLFCLVVINSLFDTVVISSQGSSHSAHFQKPLR